jgi:hypothetical protein
MAYEQGRQPAEIANALLAAYSLQWQVHPMYAAMLRRIAHDAGIPTQQVLNDLLHQAVQPVQAGWVFRHQRGANGRWSWRAMSGALVALILLTCGFCWFAYVALSLLASAGGR